MSLAYQWHGFAKWAGILLACSGLTPATAAASRAISAPAPLLTNRKPNDVELSRYSEALVEIARIERNAQNQSTPMSVADRRQAAQLANARIEAILSQSGLDRNRFNTISKWVEQDRATRRKVKQDAMRDRVGF